MSPIGEAQHVLPCRPDDVLFIDPSPQSLVNSKWHPMTLSQELSKFLDHRKIAISLHWNLPAAGQGDYIHPGHHIQEIYFACQLRTLPPTDPARISTLNSIMRQVPRGGTTTLKGFAATTLSVARPLRNPQNATEIMIASPHMSLFANVKRQVTLL